MEVSQPFCVNHYKQIINIFFYKSITLNCNIIKSRGRKKNVTLLIQTDHQMKAYFICTIQYKTAFQ